MSTSMHAWCTWIQGRPIWILSCQAPLQIKRSKSMSWLKRWKSIFWHFKAVCIMKIWLIKMPLTNIYIRTHDVAARRTLEGSEKSSLNRWQTDTKEKRTASCLWRRQYTILGCFQRLQSISFAGNNTAHLMGLFSLSLFFSCTPGFIKLSEPIGLSNVVSYLFSHTRVQMKLRAI